nr:reverse transcriptase domain-containing protein [Tanacetum cinerariifolium]
MVECLALADLGASINLMPLSVCNKISLPDLFPTCMTLELADRLISCLVGVAKDVFVKVGTFHFPADFFVVYFDADPRVPLILGRSFLKIERALIDAIEGELTLRIGKEAVTFNLEQTSRYSANYNDMTANQIDVIDMACEEYSQEVLCMTECLALGDLGVSINLMPFSVWKRLSLPNLTPTCMTLELADRSISRPVGVAEDVYVKVGSFHFLPDFVVVDFDADPRVPLILKRSFLRLKELLLMCFKSQEVLGFLIDFLLEEVDAFLAIEDDPTSPEVDHTYLDPEGDILLLEAFLNDDPSLPLQLKEIICLNPLVCPVHYVPKKGGFTVVENEDNELILTHLVMGWRVCIEYRKLNEATRKDHFPLSFMDQMLERLAGNQYYCFLNVFSGYFQTLIDLKDKEKTTFTCPYGTFAYRRMPFGLCNAP